MAAAAPIAALAAPSTAAASCPAGEDNDTYTGTCIPYLVPNSPGAATLCPPGVGGTECGSAQVPPAAPPPVAPQQPEEELEDVSTPDF
ncbi:hypothetical protein [Mycolicibacterium houstonense]|uniref:hypothetical protein n=1 Tax=Mycolicibacterium houstonense TaxID=146021 RepID=UPI000833A997|nr:hypothetical protein [Mycolicibacterium houstonense]